MLNEGQRERYKLYRQKYGMGAKSAYHQASMWTPGPNIEWDTKSSPYTHPQNGTVKDGPFTFKIRLITDEDSWDFNLHGKLEEARDNSRCDHATIAVGRRLYICPICNRPARGEGALVVYTDQHNGATEAAWFVPEDTDGYEATRKWFIEQKYGKAHADREARRYLSEAVARAKKILEHDISFLGVEVKAFVGHVQLGEASCWGFDYEDESSMEYIESEGVREQISEARYEAIKGLPVEIKLHEKYLRELYTLALKLQLDFRPIFMYSPNYEGATSEQSL